MKEQNDQFRSKIQELKRENEIIYPLQQDKQLLHCNLQSLQAECDDVKNNYEVLRVHEQNQKIEFDRLRKDHESLMDRNAKINNENTKLNSDLSV